MANNEVSNRGSRISVKRPRGGARQRRNKLTLTCVISFPRLNFSPQLSFCSFTLTRRHSNLLLLKTFYKAQMRKNWRCTLLCFCYARYNLRSFERRLIYLMCVGFWSKATDYWLKTRHFNDRVIIFIVCVINVSEIDNLSSIFFFNIIFGNATFLWFKYE